MWRLFSNRFSKFSPHDNKSHDNDIYKMKRKYVTQSKIMKQKTKHTAVAIITNFALCGLSNSQTYLPSMQTLLLLDSSHAGTTSVASQEQKSRQFHWSFDWSVGTIEIVVFDII